ncbi:hypothetical protein JYU34_006252 [Plutella xylostella]|uniref:Uncharacterized protein n=1 Tax=Plutella xylostella TaxID=51655 RepID=A0ABQ7QRK7_PLUXY|nr:hypothetical protein JYU34_006252 [Plutella xylostella]
MGASDTRHAARGVAWRVASWSIVAQSARRAAACVRVLSDDPPPLPELQGRGGGLVYSITSWLSPHSAAISRPPHLRLSTKLLTLFYCRRLIAARPLARPGYSYKSSL